MNNLFPPITFRFINWGHEPNEIEKKFFQKLFEVAFKRPVIFVESTKPYVDIQIESFYKKNVGQVDNSTRIYRFLKSNLPSGIDFSKTKYSVNQQPEKNSRYSIFYTGENIRPPEGDWDSYLSFDLHSFNGRNSYLPLWWITSTDLLFPKTSPYLGEEISIDYLLSRREPEFDRRDKFCVAFIGKSYPLRMHAISALSKIGKIDVYGAIARNHQSKKSFAKAEISKRYKFILAFENDLYPGYVTEKAPEAWATGAIPLYWGSDPEGYINQKSIINLANFKNLELFANRVKLVNDSKTIWQNYASEPFLRKKPNLNKVMKNLRTNLASLLIEG